MNGQGAANGHAAGAAREAVIRVRGLKVGFGERKIHTNACGLLPLVIALQSFALPGSQVP